MGDRAIRRSGSGCFDSATQFGGHCMDWILFSLQGAAVTLLSYALLFALARSLTKSKS